MFSKSSTEAEYMVYVYQSKELNYTNSVLE